MTTIGQSPGWFEQLRRERRLFALVATALLLLGTLQPAAMAGAAGADGWMICHGSGVGARAAEPADAPPPDCLVCLAGLCAAATALAKATPPPGSAFAAPQAAAGPLPPHIDDPAGRPRTGPPPPIRAPPFRI